MTKTLEQPDPGRHGSLRIGDPLAAPIPGLVQVVAEEFAAAAALCPVMLTKHPETGGFYVAALLGLKPGEPALVSRDELAGGFRPLDVERRGFYLADDRMAIDPGDPRFVDPAGEPLFSAGGEPGPALQRMMAVLQKLRNGLRQTDDFITAMMALKLVEPIDIDLRFDDGEKLRLGGLYTISLDALAELADDRVLALFRAGHLQLAYTMIGSVRQFSRLAQRRNAGLSAFAR